MARLHARIGRQRTRPVDHKGAMRLDEDGDRTPLDLSKGCDGYTAARMLAGVANEHRDEVIEGIVDWVAREGRTWS